MLCSAARRSRRWSQLSATGGKVQERKANRISLYSLSHNKMGFDIIYTIVRAKKKDYASKVQDEEKNENKIQALTLPLFQNLPASGKYACCEERKKEKKKKEVIFILFSQASPRKQSAQNCFLPTAAGNRGCTSQI